MHKTAAAIRLAGRVSASKPKQNRRILEVALGFFITCTFVLGYVCYSFASEAAALDIQVRIARIDKLLADSKQKSCEQDDLGLNSIIYQ